MRGWSPGRQGRLEGAGVALGSGDRQAPPRRPAPCGGRTTSTPPATPGQARRCCCLRPARARRRFGGATEDGPYASSNYDAGGDALELPPIAGRQVRDDLLQAVRHLGATDGRSEAWRGWRSSRWVRRDHPGEALDDAVDVVLVEPNDTFAHRVAAVWGWTTRCGASRSSRTRGRSGPWPRLEPTPGLRRTPAHEAVGATDERGRTVAR
jgi:hypothetical protein